MLFCSFREQQMLLNLHKKSWMEGLTLQNYNEHSSLNEDTVKEILNLATAYNKVSCFQLRPVSTYLMVGFIANHDVPDFQNMMSKKAFKN